MESKIFRISLLFAKGNSRLAASRTFCGPSLPATPTSRCNKLRYLLSGHFPSIAMQILPPPLPPLCPNKEEFGVCVGRQTFTHRKLSPVENEGEMWWFNAGGSGKRGDFLAAARPSVCGGRGGGAPMGAGERENPWQGFFPRQNGAWHREAALPSAGEKVKANQVNSAPKLKAMLGVILNFFLHARSGMRFLLLLLWDCF